MTQPRLEASIEIERTFKVGANPQPGNAFRLVITNQGEPVQQTQGLPHLFLSGFLGSDEEALFLNEKDARRCVKAIPGDWKADWDFSGGEGEKQFFRLKIYTFKKTLFNSGETVSFRFSDVESKTAPGNTSLTFESDFGGFKQHLTISKTADRPGIISFFSDPPEGVPNRPGEKVTLTWRTYRLAGRELIQVGRADPLDCNFDQDEGSKLIKVSDTDTTFRLQGYDGNRPIFRELQVRVLGPGWHDMRNTVWEGDPGYPVPQTEAETEALKEKEGFDLEPTLLFNANDQLLYGIFRCQFAGKKNAFLFQTENPMGGWKIVGSSVPDQEGNIPEGFSSSPGVYCDDRLWLIGGSQIDQENTANVVWCFDPAKGAWANWGVAPWCSRMGHAVLVFQNEIWVMGGRDESGNALSDVWSLDVESRKWTPRDKKAPWKPRCLFHPAVFKKNQIWLYGGAKEPFAEELYDDLYAFSDGEWKEKKLAGIIQGDESSRPIAACLQVFEGKLCLFGKFRTVAAADRSERVEPLAFCLTSPSTGTWESFPSDGLKNWGPDRTFSYQLVNFKDKMLIARALSDTPPNPVLKVYVPG